MARKNELKNCYEIATKTGAFYTGGKIKWSEDGETLLCSADDVINVFDVASGRVRSALGSPDDDLPDPVLCFTANQTCEIVISAHKSGLFKKWNANKGNISKSWRSVHNGPVCGLTFDDKSDTLVSGGTDGVIRLWSLVQHSCTHALSGCQGVISVLEFFRIDGQRRIFASGDDLIIRCWNAVSGKVLLELSGHFSKVTGLVLHASEHQLISCARDKVIILWDLKTGASLKTVPVYETLESIVLMPNGWHIPETNKKSSGLHVAVSGDRGVIRVFDVLTAREVYTQTGSKATPAVDGGLSVIQLLVNVSSSRFAMVTADQNIILHSVDTFQCVKQLSGFADEILDVCLFGPDDSYVAVATNSASIKVYNVADMGCQLLHAHKNIVLCLASCPANANLLLSGGKDNTVHLWELDTTEGTLKVVAEGNRHTAAVNSLCFTWLSDDTFLSASLDSTLKLWRREDFGTITVVRTELAHNSDINCVAVAPNDKFAATSSQDKSVKLWNLPELSLRGVLTGHRRGVWCVRFSPVDQILLSSSADCTIKLWSVADMTCLKTFEGHESSVIRAEFLSRGMQIISASGDGLLKLWSIKTSECMATFEGHVGKIWALSVTKNEEKLVTGGSDSLLLMWRDVTEEKKLAAIKAREELIMQEQQLNNLLQADRLLDALVLALSLDRPYKVLHIVKGVIKNGQTSGLTETLSMLTTEQKERLLKCAAAWNTNAKHCAAAQLVISIFLDQIATGNLILKDLPGYLQDVLPYTERHFKRITQALQSLQLLQFTIHQINPALVGPE